MLASTLLIAGLGYAAAAPGSSVASSASKAVSSGSSAAARTYTLPLAFISPFATQSQVPSVKPVASRSASGSASGSAAKGPVFTGTNTVSSVTAEVTFTPLPKSFVAVEQIIAPSGNANFNGTATERCVFNSTLTTTVISAAARESRSGSASSHSGSAAPSATATTITGYKANCVITEAIKKGSASSALSTTSTGIAVPVTYGSDGYFTWLSKLALSNATAPVVSRSASRSASALTSR